MKTIIVNLWTEAETREKLALSTMATKRIRIPLFFLLLYIKVAGRRMYIIRGTLE